MNWLKNFLNLIFGKRKTIIPNDPGLIASPLDHRDIPLSAVSKVVTPTPEKYRIPYGLTIKDQGSSSKCVGYVGTTIKEYLERKEGNFIEFDPDWLYVECKKRDGIPNASGTYFRTMLKVLKDTGCKPLNEPESEAYKYRIGGYMKVDCDFASLRRAIYEFGAILMGFKGSNGGWKLASIRPPVFGEEVWGHAVTGIGFDTIPCDGQNSWSESWGNNGLFYFTQKYLPFEAWAVISDLPNDWKDLLKNESSKPKYFFNNNLWKGLKNEEVKILQDCLNWLGCMKYESTGYFGTITKQAVVVFQQRYGIQPQSGYFGIITRAKMNELFI